MANEKKPHFWIPEEEIQRITKKPTSRTEPRDIVFAEHGEKLGNSLEIISQFEAKVSSDNSLADKDVTVFKVELPEGEKVQYKQDILTSNGMSINVVKDDRNAIVSATRQQFQVLKNRIAEYAHNGRNKTYFDYIENFGAFIGSEKDSSHLRREIYSHKSLENVDVQIMLVPDLIRHLGTEKHNALLEKIKNKIENNSGIIKAEPYFLSDLTPVIRALIPSSTIERYENDSAIYRIEETNFFSTIQERSLGSKASKGSKLEIDESIDIESLPIVTILDSGVEFKSPLDKLVTDHWSVPNSSKGDCTHGTEVASRVE